MGCPPTLQNYRTADGSFACGDAAELTPRPDEPPEIWVLASSPDSAAIAAREGGAKPGGTFCADRRANHEVCSSSGPLGDLQGRDESNASVEAARIQPEDGTAGSDVLPSE